MASRLDLVSGHQPAFYGGSGAIPGWAVAVAALEADRVGGRGRHRDPAGVGVTQSADVRFRDRGWSISHRGLVVQPADHGVRRAVDPPAVCGSGGSGRPVPQVTRDGATAAEVVPGRGRPAGRVVGGSAYRQPADTPISV